MSDLKDFLEFRGLDLGSGQRGVDLLKNFTSAKDLGEEYGYDVALPSLGGLSVNQFAEQNVESMIPEGKEVIKYKGKNVLVDKDRPKGYQKLRAGLADYFNLKDFYAGKGEQTDLDKMGGIATDKGYDPLGGLTEFDPTDLSQLKLNPSQQRLAGERYKGEMAGAGTPTDTIDDAMKSYFDYKRKSDIESRKGRALDSAMEFANLRTQMPFYMNQLKDLSTFKQQQLLDSELVKQSMPDQREARKLSSASRMAGELGAVAGAYGTAGEVARGGIRNPTATFSV